MFKSYFAVIRRQIEREREREEREGAKGRSVRQLYLKEKDIKRHIVREIQTERKREREREKERESHFQYCYSRKKWVTQLISYVNQWPVL